jgi:hypothetical protein
MQTWSPPQLPVESQVCAWPVAGSHRLVLGTHDPLQAPIPEQTYGHALPRFVQLPDASHCWGWVPEHFLSPGVHDPLHTPAPEQTNGQSMPLVQLPLSSQICCWLPTHCFEPGVQTVQAPVRQTVVQVKVSCQLPFKSQVCTVLPLVGLHCLAPGVQVVHAPLMHAVVQAGPLFWKTPMLSQTIG